MSTKIERLEARVSKDRKQLFQKAAGQAPLKSEADESAVTRKSKTILDSGREEVTCA